MAVLFPLVVGMLLGRAIDLRTYTVTSNVFSDEVFFTENTSVTSSAYRVADSSEDVYEAAGVEADIALHIKADFINVEGGVNGINGFMKDNSWEENTLLIPIITTYIAGKRQLPDDITPLENGIKSARTANSTHYAHALLYGGWFVLVHKIKTDHPNDMDKVKREVIGAIGHQGKADEEFLDAWQSLINGIGKLELRGKVSHEYRLYSSLPLGDEYLEPSFLISNMIKFEEEVRSRGEGYGDAIGIWLYPLTDVDSTFEEVQSSRDYGKELLQLNTMFDDLRDTQSLMLSWTTAISIELTNEQEQQISKLLDDVDDAMQVFFTVIPEISVYKKIDKSLLDKAFNAYERTLPIKGGTYHLAYRRLKESIDAVCQDSFHDKVLGQLKLDQDQIIGPIETPNGIEECKQKCFKESRCRSIAYGEKLSTVDKETGVWEAQNNVCWIHFRSTETTPFQSSSEWIGDVYVYDRKCI